jgi:hypothetical protein
MKVGWTKRGSERGSEKRGRMKRERMGGGRGEGKCGKWRRGGKGRVKKICWSVGRDSG